MAAVATTDLIKQLTEGVAALTSTQQWERWLRAQRAFHRYSFSNVLLILRQFPEATRVAGFHRWHELGRFVRKGERGIAILAPVTRRVEADDDPDALMPVVTGFRPAYVFDITQTDGEPLPEIAHRLDGADRVGASIRLEKVAAELGFSVSVTQLPGERNGDCSHELRRIRISERLAPAHQVKTLAHELAHAILHEHFDDRGLAELEAESVAYIVCHELALDSSAYSFGYLASWARGGDEATGAITASGGRITAAARQILDGRAAPAAPLSILP
jgi:antirestriction protein ArdC